MTTPPMLVVLVVLLMTMSSPGIAVVEAKCRAPLTVLLTGIFERRRSVQVTLQESILPLLAQSEWSAWIGDSYFEGPNDFGGSLAPYTSVERVTNITVFMERTTLSIRVMVKSTGIANHGLMASVSYNGVKFATTGDAASRWSSMHTSVAEEIYYWPDIGAPVDVSLWSVANSTGSCDANSMPSLNRDGLSYSDTISANGMTPASNSPEYGGETAHWIGMYGNNGNCSVDTDTAAVYHMTLDLMSLAKEPICVSKHDGRALLSPDTPIVHLLDIGKKTATTRAVTVVGATEGRFDVWVDGIGAETRRGKYYPNGNAPESWARLSQMDFNVEPKSNNLVAMHARIYEEGRRLIANILYEGQLYTASDNLAQWKFLNGGYMTDPGAGWNTDPNFNDTAWLSMSDLISCDSPAGLSEISQFLNQTYGGCANWVWHRSGCVIWDEDTNENANKERLFVRIRMNLVNLKSQPPLQCKSEPWTNDSPKEPTWPLTDLEIVAIASGATFGSLLIVAGFHVRRYRSRRPKTKVICAPMAQLSIVTSNHFQPTYARKWSVRSPTQSITQSQSSRMHLANFPAPGDVSERPRLMGELAKKLAMRSNSQPSPTWNSVTLSMNHDANTLPELIKIYQQKRCSIGRENVRSSRASLIRTHTSTRTTRTDRTLVDVTTHGLEIPGFLQVKEGIDYNLDKEFTSGGGGSLYRGQMFARGLPNLNVIVKKMTNSSLPAFRQEVALMWLFNDNENMVKLMGFNEVQLAIVMPDYWMGSLKQFIGAEEYDCKVTRSLLLDIARGLFAMHSNGVVHNDIKPDNILLEPHSTKRVNAVITDFGISNVVEDKVLTVRAFEVKNKGGLTMGYAAPEVIIRFRNKDKSRVPPGEAKAGDVYSFAIVIHALLRNVRST